MPLPLTQSALRAAPHLPDTTQQQRTTTALPRSKKGSALHKARATIHDLPQGFISDIVPNTTLMTQIHSPHTSQVCLLSRIRFGVSSERGFLQSSEDLRAARQLKMRIKNPLVENGFCY